MFVYLHTVTLQNHCNIDCTFRRCIQCIPANSSKDTMPSDRKRQVFGYLLLAVYLFILSISICHVHSEQKQICNDCISHVKHNGHYIDISHSVDKCILCAFISTSYIATKLLTLFSVSTIISNIKTLYLLDIVSKTSRVANLRAPPVCLQ